ncbi:MAG: HAD-IIA family hydrolase [Mycobacteriaceae bacterium]|nr:HAD-IIA family hydrolase [Mycobacteriaceae bacterium]
MKTLAQEYDCLLVDLDGTVFHGQRPIDGAAQSLAELPGRALFITNNASRSAAEVAEHLGTCGVSATKDDVVTSAQVAASVLAKQLPAGSPVLIVGTQSLADEIAGVGLRPVRRWADKPVAVVQGHSPATGWPDLAEATLAIRAGALWVATNTDPTLPSELGLLPGNGSMVAALRTSTDTEPQVVGKPSPMLVRDALARGDFRAPLVIGDRLDTDIACANAAGLPSLMVLTGVCSVWDAIAAEPAFRPTYLAADLRCLHRDAGQLAVAPQPAWHVEICGRTLTVSGHLASAESGDDGLSIIRAVAWAVWNAAPDATISCHGLSLEPGDDRARDALRRAQIN